MLTYILSHIGAAGNANRNLKTMWSAQDKVSCILNM